MSENRELGAKGELGAVLRQFVHFRSWDWSLWVALTLGLVFTVVGVIFSFPEGSLSTRFLQAAICLSALVAGLFQQFLVSRSVKHAGVRVFALVSSFFCMAFYTYLICEAAGMHKMEARDRIVFHCVTVPNAKECRRLVRESPDLRRKIPPDLIKAIEARSAAGATRKFADLTGEQQQFVKHEYLALLTAYEKKEFPAMLERSRAILAYLDEYNDTRSYDSIAKKGLIFLEEERKRKDAEARIAALKLEVRKLEEELKLAHDAAQKNQEAVPAFEAVLAKIFERDPANRLASDLKRGLQQRQNEENLAKVRRELASLEIKGQRLARKGRKDAVARAELYKLIDEIYLRDPDSKLPEEWKRLLKR